MARKTKPKTRTVTARVVGAVPHDGYSGALWRVRLTAPFLPFYLDGKMNYPHKADADKEAEKWRRRKITITFPTGGER